MTDICTCGCHYPTKDFIMMHFAPCCEYCPHCGERIVVSQISHHRRTCVIKLASAVENTEILVGANL